MLVAAFLAVSIFWMEPGLGAAGPLALVQPTDPEIGSLPPEAAADTLGMYGAWHAWPLVSIHATLVQSGDIVTYGSPLGVKQQGAMVFDHWTPATDEHVQSPQFAVDSFCNINVATTDGRLMMAGGNSQMTSGTYDFDTRTYSSLPNFAYPRWYASMIRLPDERFVVMGGAEPKASEGEVETRFSSTPEILSPGASSWTSLPGARSVSLFGSPDYAWWYPKAYLAPSGNVFGISQDRMWILDPDGSGSITDVGGIPGTGFGSSASSVMYAPGRILLAGGGQQINNDGQPGSAEASIIDIRSDVPTVTSTGSMARPRNWLNLTVLPNGEVLASGGTEVGVEGTPVKANEIWNPATGTWRTLDSAMKTRTYHSTALLMPSGGVFTSGGGLPGPVNNFSSQYYYPPNLFDRNSNGDVVWADRPEFRNVTGVIARGGTATFGMKDDRRIVSMSLTSAGSVTHSYDANQRRVPLSFTQSGSVVTAHFPAGATALPSGVYLLHAVDAEGVPAPSQIIEIEPDGSPGEITVYGTGPVVPPAAGPTPTTTPTTTSPPPTTTSPPSTTTSTTTTPPSTTTTTTTTPPSTTTSPPTTTTTAPTPTTTTAPPTTTTPPPTTTTIVASSPPVVGHADSSPYSGLTPTRILDTRIGLGARHGPIGAGETISVKVTDVGGAPADGVEAVALNVTVTDTSAPSFLTVSPHGTPRPTASNLNWDAAGVTKANAVVVAVGSGGMIDLYNLAGTTHAIIDVAGWFREGGGFHAVSPDRVLDTRLRGGAAVQGPGDVGLELGASAMPAGAVGVVFNATSTGATEHSYVSAYPAGAERPGSSNLNIAPGQTTANLAVSRLGVSGDVTLFNRFGSTHLIADVAGWFSAGSGYTGTDPTRLVDTRATRRLGAGRTMSVPVRGAGTGVPESARVVIVNVTAVLPTAPSFLTVFPTGEAWPTASNLNFGPGMVVPNLVFATIGDDGSIDIGNAHGEVDVLVDLFGYLS